MKFTYNPDKDIPNLTGKVILLTGGTAGVGKEAVLELAKHSPKHIYFTGRNAQAAEAVITACKSASSNLTFISCDQTSLSSVSQAAKLFLQKSENQLDILICNAGVMAIPPGVSKDGYEIQFAINHLAHALLIKLCLPALLKAAEEKGDARIVSVTSLGFKSAPKEGIIFKDLKTSQESFGWSAKFILYGQSKLANVLYASHLAKLYPKLTVTSIHPGLILGTNLTDQMGWFDRTLIRVVSLHLPRIKMQEGAYNTLWAATSIDKNLQTGGIYEPVGKVVEGTKQSEDETLEEALWEWTKKELETYS
ncbi:NAD(P)-binding protein [Stipitochalara longipes BDJ]|nr:NAD(P)-binding protein [Stipitochalara longipes BDJ]